MSVMSVALRPGRTTAPVALLAALLLAGALPLLPVSGTNDPPSTGGDVVGDWTVTAVLAPYRDVTIHVTGNVKIQNGGRLTLENSTLVMNSSAAQEYRITVESGGRLDIMNGSLVRANATAPRPYYFHAQSGSTLRIERSTVQEAGNATQLNLSSPSLAALPFLGVDVETGDAVVANSTIRKCPVGLVLLSPFTPIAPTVRNTTLVDNSIGAVAAVMANPQLIANTYLRNSLSGLSAATFLGATVSGGTFDSNGFGFFGIGLLAPPLYTVTGASFVNNSVGLITAGASLSLGQSQVQDSSEAGVVIAGNNSRVTGTLTDVTLVGNRNDTAFSMADVAGQNVLMSGTLENQYILNGSAKATLLRSTVDRSRIHFNDSTSSLNASWDLRVTGLYENASRAVNASLTVTNRTGAVRVLLNLDNNGSGGPFLLHGFTATRDTLLDESPYTALAVRGDYRNSTSWNHTTTTNLALVLRLTDIVPPIVLIDKPGAGDRVRTPTLRVAGRASDNRAVTAVEVSLDGAGWTLANGTANWTADVPLGADGSHTVRVRATDAFANRGTANVTIVLDTIAPAIAITSPQDGHLTNSSAVLILGTTTGTLVEINGNDTVPSNGTFALAVALVQEGANTVMAIARDEAGNTASDTITIVRDSIAPVLVLLAPAPGAVVTNATVAVSGEANDTSGIARVEISVNAGPYTPTVVTPSAGGVTWTSTLDLPEGSSTILVRAKDLANNSGFGSVAVTVVLPDLTPPLITILFPKEGDVLAEGRIVAVGRASDNRGLVRVEASGDGVNWTPSADKQNWTVIVLLRDGPGTIWARATDSSGLSTMVSVGVVVHPPDTEKPAVKVTSHHDGQTVRSRTITLVGTATDNVGVVKVSVTRGIGPGSTTALASGTASWSQELLLRPGQNIITIGAIDAANNTGSVTIFIRYEEKPAAPVNTAMFGVLILALLLVVIFVAYAMKDRAKVEAEYQRELAKSKARKKGGGGGGAAAGAADDEEEGEEGEEGEE